MEYCLGLFSRAVDERRLRLEQREAQARQAEQELARSALTPPGPPSPPSPGGGPGPRVPQPPEEARAPEPADLRGFQPVSLTDPADSGAAGPAAKSSRETLSRFASDAASTMGRISALLLERLDRGDLCFTCASVASELGVPPRGLSNYIRALKNHGVIQPETGHGQSFYRICTDPPAVPDEPCDPPAAALPAQEMSPIALANALASSSSARDRRIGSSILRCMSRGEITRDDYAALGEASKWQSDMFLAAQLGLVDRVSSRRCAIRSSLRSGPVPLTKNQKKIISEMYECFGDDLFSFNMVIATLDYSEAAVHGHLHVFTLLHILDCHKDDVNRYQFLVNPDSNPEYFDTAA